MSRSHDQRVQQKKQERRERRRRLVRYLQASQGAHVDHLYTVHGYTCADVWAVIWDGRAQWGDWARLYYRAQRDNARMLRRMQMQWLSDPNPDPNEPFPTTRPGKSS